MLPENKNEIDNSPQPPNIKYSGGTSDLPFSGYNPTQNAVAWCSG